MKEVNTTSDYTLSVRNTLNNPNLGGNASQVPKLLYPVHDVMAATGYSRSTIYAAINDGRLPVVRLGRSVRIPAAALNRWIEDQTNA